MKRKTLRTLAIDFLAAVLLAGSAQAATPEIRVDSWKGCTLEAGERSLLIIGPAGAEYTVSSSNPDAVAIERVLTYWVAVAKAEGTAEVTVTDADGTTGNLTLTVGAAEPSPVPSETLDLSANTLCCGENRVRLSAREFDVMRQLMREPDHNLSKEVLLQRVWGQDTGASENHVEVYVGFLRKKLRSIGSNVRIAAARRLGYHLEVEEL